MLILTAYVFLVAKSKLSINVNLFDPNEKIYIIANEHLRSPLLEKLYTRFKISKCNRGQILAFKCFIYNYF